MGRGRMTQDETVVINECAGVVRCSRLSFEGNRSLHYTGRTHCHLPPGLNASRMADSARRLEMPVFPEDRFVEAVVNTVKANAAYVPPYGSGATLYIRPYMFSAPIRVIGVNRQMNISSVLLQPRWSVFQRRR